MSANYELRGNVAVITLDNPPVNGLGHATRLGIVNGLDKAIADAAVKAIVITGAGKAFSGGADIKEFGSPKALAEPNLLSVILALEASSKPIVAAIHTVCMGGGLELALGCHYRVASPGVQVALPEVKIGLIPGAGGTQRLPRVIGVENAMNMIVSGEPVKSELLAQAPGQKLFDKMIDGDLLAGALAFAAEVADKRPLSLVRDLKVKHPNAEAYLQFVKNMVGGMSKNFPAPLKCVEAVAGSLKLPFDQGMRLERELFTGLMFTPESKALRHAFMAERATTKIPDVPADTPVRDVKKLAVIGAGTMGGGIAMNFLNAGIPVTILEMKQEALDKGVAIIRKNYEAQVKKGKLKQDKYDGRMALLSTTLNYADLKDADMVIEAVFEDMGVKETVFKTLDEVMKPGAILASNTSTLDVNKIASFTKRPQDVIGTHFFSPANVMKLLEVVRAAKTSPQAIVTTMALAKTIGKVGVLAGNADGFIGNRILAVYGRECDFLLEEGATPWQVDRALQGFGFPMGLYLMRDMSGLDVGWRIRQYREQFRDKRLRYSPIADRLCELGRFGQKTAKGYYLYDGRNATPDPAVETLIEQVAKDLNIARRAVSDDEIVTRVLTAMANEGLKILGEGIALRAGDIDVAYVHGYGFPRHQGGPMYWADQRGWGAVYDTVRHYHASQGALWAPAPRLVELAARAQAFERS